MRNIFLVKTEVGADLQFAPVELLRPVALLTGLPCRPQVLDGGRNGPWKGIEEYSQHLPGTGQF